MKGTVTHALDLLEQMSEAVGMATVFIEGYDRDSFLRDKRTRAAVSMYLIVIGEAASRLLHNHSALLGRYPEVPWRRITDMRNQIAHGYVDLDFEAVWDTALNDLPSLDHTLSLILKSLPEQAGPMPSPTSAP